MVPGHAEVALDAGALRGMEASRALIDRIATSDGAVYGVNTGFGKMATVRISSKELCALQTNLVRSHACGGGPPLGEPETRAMILLCANALAKGYRGVHDRERLCDRNRPRPGGHRRFQQFDLGWLRDVRYRELQPGSFDTRATHRKRSNTWGPRQPFSRELPRG